MKDRPKFLMCPVCKTRIGVPSFIAQATIKGEVRLKCGICKKGTAVIKPVERVIG